MLIHVHQQRSVFGEAHLNVDIQDCMLSGRHDLLDRGLRSAIEVTVDLRSFVFRSTGSVAESWPSVNVFTIFGKHFLHCDALQCDRYPARFFFFRSSENTKYSNCLFLLSVHSIMIYKKTHFLGRTLMTIVQWWTRFPQKSFKNVKQKQLTCTYWVNGWRVFAVID